MPHSEEEYQKRIKIVKDITKKIKHSVEAVVIGGSVGYHNVESHCDIDMVIVIEKDKIDEFASLPYFRDYINKNVIELFRQGNINLFWVTKIVNSIEVNYFIYDSQGYQDYCLLVGDRIGFIKKKPKDSYCGYGFGGEKICFDRNVKEIKEGFLYTHPALVGGKYYGGVPRDDFFYLAYIAYEKERFFTKLREKVWKVIIRQFIKEYGMNYDLSKASPLKAIFLYNWQIELDKKLMNDEIVNKINARLNDELKISIL